jgi:hypothetical protein
VRPLLWVSRRLVAWAETPTDRELAAAFSDCPWSVDVALGVEDRARLWFRDRAHLEVREFGGAEPWCD